MDGVEKLTAGVGKSVREVKSDAGLVTEGDDRRDRLLARRQVVQSANDWPARDRLAVQGRVVVGENDVVGLAHRAQDIENDPPLLAGAVDDAHTSAVVAGAVKASVGRRSLIPRRAVGRGRL